jgi:uncharacterized repeat protein (TIGR02543 family)
MKEKMKRVLVTLLAFCMLCTSVPVYANIKGKTRSNIIGLGTITETEVTGGNENDDGAADVVVEEETDDPTEIVEDTELPADDEKVIEEAESDSVEEEEDEPEAAAEEDDRDSARSTVMVNHYMLSPTSSNVIVYVTTGNNEELTILEPGVAFETENPDTYFFVEVVEGYGSTTKFRHDWVQNEPNRTEFPSNLGGQESTYVSIYDSSYSPCRQEDAIEEGCTYMFQYTSKSGVYGNFWTLFEIKANPVEVVVSYNANDNASAKATNIPADQDGYYHTNVTEVDKNQTAAAKDPHTIVISSNVPKREGYTFGGWLGSDGKKYQPGDSVSVDKIWDYLTVDSTTLTAEFALKAIWQKDKKKVTISYDGNGSTGGQAVVDDKQPYDEGTEVKVCDNTWRKKNCKFVGWNTQADGGGKSYAEGSTITLTENTTLYAQWTPRGAVQLRYVMVGGATGHTGLTTYAENVLPEAENETITGSTVSLSPNSDGIYEYKFLGWSTTTNESDIFNTNATFKPSRNDDEEFTAKIWYAIFKKLPVLTITGENKTSAYNGTTQTVSGYTVAGTAGISDITTNEDGTTTFVYENKTYTINNVGVTAASGVNANDTPYVEIIDASGVTITCNGADVTSDFIAKSVNGSLTIKKRNVTITSASETKEYDGTALTNSSYTITGEVFVAADMPTITVTGSQTLVGTSKNTFTYTGLSQEAAANYNITAVEGNLTVFDRSTKYEIALAPIGKTTTYNGNVQTSEGLTLNGQTLTAGTDGKYAFTCGGVSYTIEGVSVSGSGVNAGTYTLTVDGTPVIRDASGSDVSAQFLPTMTTGMLTITPKAVTITSASGEKKYDGTPLSKNNVATDITVKGFVDGQGASITFDSTATQTAVGTAQNTFTYALNAGTLASNYTITCVYGTLRVTALDAANKIPLSITANSGTSVYDGKPHTAEGFVNENDQHQIVVERNGLTYYITGLTASVTGTDAGTYKVIATGTPVVTDSYGNVVTDQFNLTVIPGSLTIGKRTITVQAVSASKTYDGTSLSDGNVTILNGSFADGEGADFVVTGARTLVGTASNIITGIDYYTGTKEANYNINRLDGTLTIVSRDAEALFEVTIEANSATATYDGTEQSVSGFKNENDDSRIPVTVGTVTYYVDVNALSASASATNAGTYTTAINGAAVVYDADGNDVTDQFLVNVTPGKLTINKRNVILSSETVSGEYNTSGLTATTVEVDGDGFADGEGAAYTFPSTSKVTLPNTTVTNVFSYELNENTNADNYNISVNYGKLTMTGLAEDAKYRLLVEANSGSFVYDGTAHTVGGIKNDTFTVAGETGKVFTVSGLSAADVTATDYKKGGYTVSITGTATVTDNNGNDVTSLFIIETKDGTLNIEKRPVLLTSASAQKTYDGTALTAETVTDRYNTAGGYNAVGATETSGFVNGDSAIYRFTGTRTLPGTSENTFTYVLTDTTNADNYNISTANGSLIVTDRTADEAAQYTIALQPVSGETIYNGAEQRLEGFEETNFTFDGQTYKVSGITAVSRGTEPGVYESVYSGTPVVTDADGNDVTNQFTFDLSAVGTLTIKGIYTLTINYVDTTGRTLAASYVERFVEGTTFGPIVSPTIEGYTPNFASVSSPASGMPTRDISVDVVYTANANNTTDNTTTTPDETTTTPDNTTTPEAAETPAVTPEQTVTTPAETPNNTLVPAAPAQIADNGEVIDNTTIEDEDVPEGVLAFDENGNPEIVDIEDEATALASGAGGAAWALINLIAAILTAVICILLLISLLKRKKDEDEEEEETESKKASEEDEDEKRKKQRVLVKVLGIIPAVASVIAFILTENMKNPMRWVDRWTILMIILLVIEILMACFSSKKEKVEKDEEETE